MNVSLADAKAHLSALVEQVMQGENVVITKRGKPVAQLSALSPKRKPIDVEALRRLTDSMPLQSESAGDFVRAMRDSDRY
jgi:prevent-host-death family protein